MTPCLTSKCFADGAIITRQAESNRPPACGAVVAAARLGLWIANSTVVIGRLASKPDPSRCNWQVIAPLQSNFRASRTSGACKPLNRCSTLAKKLSSFDYDIFEISSIDGHNVHACGARPRASAFAVVRNNDYTYV